MHDKYMRQDPPGASPHGASRPSMARPLGTMTW